jgi:hypothetical protein
MHEASSRITAKGASLWNVNTVRDLLPEPQGNVAAIAQRFIILVPVLDAIRCFVCWMSMGLFVGLRHAHHRWRLGVSMSKP